MKRILCPKCNMELIDICVNGPNNFWLQHEKSTELYVCNTKGCERRGIIQIPPEVLNELLK
jgi:hypothetical protein